jgi:hypothetical protein
LLQRLDALDPFDKELAIDGLATAVLVDGLVNVEEAELLQLICACLHCPPRPFMGLLDGADEAATEAKRDSPSNLREPAFSQSSLKSTDHALRSSIPGPVRVWPGQIAPLGAAERQQNFALLERVLSTVHCRRCAGENRVRRRRFVQPARAALVLVAVADEGAIAERLRVVSLRHDASHSRSGNAFAWRSSPTS